MRKFETNVQLLKYKVLREVARHAWNGDEPFSVFNEIAKEVVKKGERPTRCCIYKDRAIVADRIRIALGGNKKNPNIIEVIDIACDECPEAGHSVTDLCRGCIAHACHEACPVDAISFDEKGKAYIDKSKCVECGRCKEACPYSAIINYKRPCEKSCKVNAIHMADTGEAEIDYDKCVSCGACVRQCPFGATVDKSYIVDIINLIRDKIDGNYRVHAIIAPAFASQFNEELGKSITAIKELGFDTVSEVAQAADIVAWDEAKELEEKGFLITSCCPAFVKYIKDDFPEMVDKISHNLSPMAMMGKIIKDKYPEDKVVFIGPCIAKKAESQLPVIDELIDFVMTYEELASLFDSKEIDINALEPSEFVNSSPFGRMFARGGGVAQAVVESLKESGSEFDAAPIACEGLDKCKIALLRASKNVLPFDLIEGMACEGGCVGGAGNIRRETKNKKLVDKYASEASISTIEESVKETKLWNI